MQSAIHSVPPPAPGVPAGVGNHTLDLQKSQMGLLTALNHEIRTPLTGILGMADLLLESELSAEQREYVQSTRLCAENLLESLSTALEYAAVSSGQLKLSESAFRLEEVVRTAIAGLENRAHVRGISIRLFCEPEAAAGEAFIGDAVRIRQVVSLLLSHAVKSCVQEEVAIAVTTYPSGSSRHHIMLTLSILDNGSSVDDRHLQNIFDPPELAGYGHAGMELGLPLANRLVTAMGGVLQAEAVIGSGTMFTVTMPLRIPETTADSVQRNAPAGAPARPSILLVEDNEVAQRFMRTVLERKGYEVHVAANGQEAVTAVADCIFDLILMDVQMPGMDGLEATRIIRAMPDGRRTPIVACTANTSSDVRNECVLAGMDDFLPKPVHTAELVEIVGKYLRTRP